MMTTNKIAITGAFGYSGKYITQALLDQGSTDIITLTGHPDRPNPFDVAIPAFPFNFQDPTALTKTLEGVHTLYNTYWIRFAHGEMTFDRAVANSKTLFDAAKAAGVERIIHVSITNPSLISPLPYFKGKAELEEHIKSLGIPYTILRPTVIFAPEDILINNIAYLIRRFPFFVVPGTGEYQLQPIYAKDLAALAVQAGASTEYQIIDAIGPETFTFNQLLDMLMIALGRQTRIIHLPPAIGLNLSRIVGVFLGDVVLTNDEVEGLSSNLLVTKSPPAGQTSLTEWASTNVNLLGVKYASELRRHY